MKRLSITLLILFVLLYGELKAQPHVVCAKQGTTMLTQMDNRGAFGRVSYLLEVPPPDSIGVDFPVGGQIEHLYGGGLWVGALIDTTSGGNGPTISAVSTAFDGYSGRTPRYEFSPGPSSADSIWKVYGAGAPKPAGWDAYWGSSLPYHPVADQNFYCTYSDDVVRPAGHVPLGLKVIQSSYTWDAPSDQGIQIVCYRIICTGARTLDSCYLAFYADADVGPIGVPEYYLRNASDFSIGPLLGYTLGMDSGSTPFGVDLLYTPPASRLTFAYDGLDTGLQTDSSNYSVISSGIIMPSEFPQFGDTRFLLAKGPYTLHPADTLQCAVALLSSARDLLALTTTAQRAIDLYNTVVTSVGKPEGLPGAFRLLQNYPNPFNPTTEVEFWIADGGLVSLKLYDLLGREVATLVNEEKKPGTYSVTFEGRNLASGVYFYQLRAGGNVMTKKLVLLR